VIKIDMIDEEPSVINMIKKLFEIYVKSYQSKIMSPIVDI